MMMEMRRNRVWIGIGLGLAGVLGGLLAFLHRPIYFEDDWMDSPKTRDFADLVSEKKISDKNRPVIITCHGYTGTTFEWKEFKAFAEKNGHVLVSSVLLGGHGRDLEIFRKSSWRDWRKPIEDEYLALVGQGYKHISIAASSTSATLVATLIAEGFFDRSQKPTAIVFVDPLVRPRDRSLYLVPYIKFFLKNSPVYKGRPKIVLQHWYNNRPVESLLQLLDLLKTVEKELPVKMPVKIYQGKDDPVCDPKGALMIGWPVEFVGSNHHVFTQGLTHKELDWSAKDGELQRRVFEEIMRAASQ
jgi:carboxylesterase